MSNVQQPVNDTSLTKVRCLSYSLIVGLGLVLTTLSFLFFMWYDFRKETVDHFNIYTYERIGLILAGMAIVFLTNYIFDKLFGWYPLEQLKLKLCFMGFWFWSAVALLTVLIRNIVQ